MLNKLKRLLQGDLINDKDEEESRGFSDQLAAAALMVEVIAADYQLKEEERQYLVSILQKRFTLAENEAESLLNEAKQAHQNATDYFAFTSQINQRYSQEKKIELIHILWQLANADEEIHEIEQHVIRRISNLLHVSHNDYIAAKLAATGHS